MSEAGESSGSIKLTRILKTVEVLRTLEPEMPLQKAAAFLVIALNPEGIPMKEIADQLGVYLSTANRNVAALGEKHWAGKKGLDLVTHRPDPSEPRRKLMFLTPKGKQVTKSLLDCLQ